MPCFARISAPDGCLRIVECRKTMKENDVGIAGLPQEVHGYAVFFKLGDSLGEFGFLAHGDPDVCVEDIGARKGFVGVSYLEELYLAAGRAGHAFHVFRQGFIRPQFLGRQRDEMHAHLGAPYHEGIAHIAARIAAIHHLDLVERLASMLLDGEKISEYLRRVIVVGQSIPHRNAGVFGQVLNEFLGEPPVLNAVVHPPEHFSRILDGFFLPHLGICEEGRVSAFVPTGCLERATRPRRSFIENENDIFAVQSVPLDAGAFFRLLNPWKDRAGNESLRG